VLTIPVKHGDGCWHPGPDLQPANVVLRYASARNPNGSIDDVAGVVNDQRNVMGLMPHPEHAVEALLGSTDGALILGSMLDVAHSRSLAAA
jgi:phosphoribosylformylglycinamidine synthase